VLLKLPTCWILNQASQRTDRLFLHPSLPIWFPEHNARALYKALARSRAKDEAWKRDIAALGRHQIEETDMLGFYLIRKVSLEARSKGNPLA
jgi:hypothetical protein